MVLREEYGLLGSGASGHEIPAHGRECGFGGSNGRGAEGVTSDGVDRRTSLCHRLQGLAVVAPEDSLWRSRDPRGTGRGNWHATPCVGAWARLARRRSRLGRGFMGGGGEHRGSAPGRTIIGRAPNRGARRGLPRDPLPRRLRRRGALAIDFCYVGATANCPAPYLADLVIAESEVFRGNHGEALKDDRRGSYGDRRHRRRRLQHLCHSIGPAAFTAMSGDSPLLAPEPRRPYASREAFGTRLASPPRLFALGFAHWQDDPSRAVAALDEKHRVCAAGASDMVLQLCRSSRTSTYTRRAPTPRHSNRCATALWPPTTSGIDQRSSAFSTVGTLRCSPRWAMQKARRCWPGS